MKFDKANILLFVALLGSVIYSWRLHAVLTNAQVFENVGRMVVRGIMQDGSTITDKQAEKLVKWASDYRLNGSLIYSLQDKTEAMKSFGRTLFTAMGRDPDAEIHYYKKHFLDTYVPGEGDALEP